MSTLALAHMVVPLAATILCLLFLVQRWGTHRVGSLFGPVMVVWFGAIGLAGLREVMAQPGVLAGLSPWYAALFVAGHPAIAFVALGAVVLAVTGAEALYADMGHFGRAPIRRAWFAIVFTALTLNYLGQAGLLLRHPASKTDPFFLLLPGWARLAMVALATVATVIASRPLSPAGFRLPARPCSSGSCPTCTSATHRRMKRARCMCRQSTGCCSRASWPWSWRSVRLNTWRPPMEWP